MGLDIRLPLGYVFVVLGVILTGYGAATWNSAMYAISMGIDVNLVWGLAMLVLGGLTLVAAKKR
jgi:hypothetical protein